MSDLIKFDPDKHKILLGCVTENNPKYLSQALRLLQSLRWFRGKVANTASFFGIYLASFKAWSS